MHNDIANKTIGHLKNTNNLYDSSNRPALITAEINITFEEFKEIIIEINKEFLELDLGKRVKNAVAYYKSKKVRS